MVYVRAHQNAEQGFQGGLNWYKTADLNWELTPQLAEAKCKIPAFLILGTKDIAAGGDSAKAIEMTKRWCEDFKGSLTVEGKGHWIQNEASAEVNEALLKFLNQFPEGTLNQAKPAWQARAKL